MKEIEALRKGIRHGVWLFAVWKDGEQWVGSPEKRLQYVLDKIDNGDYDEDLLSL